MSAAPTGHDDADRPISAPTVRSPTPSSAPTRSTRPGGHAGDPNVAVEVPELARRRSWRLGGSGDTVAVATGVSPATARSSTASMHTGESNWAAEAAKSSPQRLDFGHSGGTERSSPASTRTDINGVVTTKRVAWAWSVTHHDARTLSGWRRNRPESSSHGATDLGGALTVREEDDMARPTPVRRGTAAGSNRCTREKRNLWRGQFW